MLRDRRYLIHIILHVFFLKLRKVKSKNGIQIWKQSTGWFLFLFFYLSLLSWLSPPSHPFICLSVHSGVTSCGAFWYLWNLIWNLDSIVKRSEFIFQWTVWIWEGRRNWWIYFLMFLLWRTEQCQFFFFFFFFFFKKDLEALI